MSVTISDIARHAKVDKSTVSLVLSNKKSAVRISENTRQRVMKIVDELDYKPNMLAQSLRGGMTRTIGILWCLNGPHPTASMVHRMASYIQKNDFIPYVIDSKNDTGIIMQALKELSARRADGVIVEGGYCVEADQNIHNMLKQFKAAVMINQHRQPVDIDQVVHDRMRPIEEVADHFCKIGCKYPAIASAGDRFSDKVATFVSRLTKNGIQMLPENHISIFEFRVATEDEQSGSQCYAALEKCFAGTPISFDALLCTADEMAVAAISWLKKRGLKVPQDVAVVGFNDHESSQYLDPPLASIERLDAKVATIVDQMLLSRIENPTMPVRCEKVSMQFVWRGSAG